MGTNLETVFSEESRPVKQWSDEICRNISNLDLFPAHVLDSNVQKKIIERFLNFYLGGKVPKGLSAADLVFSVISIMPLHMGEEGPLWNKGEYAKDGTLFLLSPEDVVQANTQNNSESSLSKYDKLSTSAHSTTETETVNESISQNINAKQGRNEVKVLQPYVTELDAKPSEDSDKCIEQLESCESKIETRKSFDQGEVISHNNSKIEQRKDNDNDDQKYREIEDMKQQEELKSETKPSSEIKEIQISKPEETETPILKILENTRFAGRMNYIEVYKNRPQLYGPKENAALISSCKRLMEHWETDDKARIALKFFFGIVALISMRGLTKSYRHLTNTYAGYKFDEYIKYINTFSDYGFEHCLPHKQFVSVCYRTFRKKERNTVIMFAKIINFSSIVDDQLNVKPKTKRFHNLGFPDFGDNPFKMNFFRSTVLSHTANYKLELVTLVQGISDKIGVDCANSAIEVTYCKGTAESWRRLKEYFNNYLTPDSITRTHHWARVFDEEYFQELSCQNNYPLAVILAVFNAEMTRNQGIWLSLWIDNNNEERLTKFKKIGLRMFNTFMRKNKRAVRILKHHWNADEPENRPLSLDEVKKLLE